MKASLRLQSPDLLRAVMAEQDKTIRVLALQAGCHTSMITHLRAGRSERCNPELAQRIARALGRRTAELFVADVSTVNPKRS